MCTLCSFCVVHNTVNSSLTLSTILDGQHARRGVKVDTSTRKRFYYRNKKLRRRRNPKAENLDDMVDTTVATDRQKHRDDLEKRVLREDEARWERVGQLLQDEDTS